MTASQDRPVPSRWPDGVRRSWPLVLPTFAGLAAAVLTAAVRLLT